MAGRRLGPIGAALVAVPVWVTLLVDTPAIGWFTVAVALIHLAFVALIAVWVTHDPQGRRWLADRGALATWTAFGGLAASPAVILQMGTLFAVLALCGLGTLVVVMSPVLSDRAGELFDRLVVPEPEVRPIPKLGDLPPPMVPPDVRMIPQADAS